MNIKLKTPGEVAEHGLGSGAKVEKLGKVLAEPTTEQEEILKEAVSERLPTGRRYFFGRNKLASQAQGRFRGRTRFPSEVFMGRSRVATAVQILKPVEPSVDYPESQKDVVEKLLKVKGELSKVIIDPPGFVYSKLMEEENKVALATLKSLAKVSSVSLSLSGKDKVVELSGIEVIAYEDRENEQSNIFDIPDSNELNTITSSLKLLLSILKSEDLEHRVELKTFYPNLHSFLKKIKIESPEVQLLVPDDTDGGVFSRRTKDFEGKVSLKRVPFREKQVEELSEVLLPIDGQIISTLAIGSLIE